MRLYEGLGTALLALGAAWTQAGTPAPVPGDTSRAPGVASPTAPGLVDDASASQDTTLVNPDAPDAVGFDAATFQRVVEFELRFGTFAEGLQQVASWAEEDDFAAARLLGQRLLAPDLLSSWRAQLELEDSKVVGPVLAASDPVIDWLGLGARSRAERAHVRFALGVIDLAEDLPERAQSEFEATRAAAEDAGLRGDAIYNLGTLALQEGELWRSQIPELGGQPPAPVAPMVPGGPPAPGADEEPPDPLEQARGYYLKAKDHYVERLRLDPTDADTRANTELVFRRLRELDEIEQQREEQQQEQEQDPDEQEESEDEQEQQEQEQDQQDQQQQDQQQDGDSEQEPEPQDEEPEPEEPEEQDQDQEGETQEGDPQESEAQPQPRDEQYLTKEEVQRLLDRLEQHEELGKQLLERQRQAQQRSSARDW